MSSPQFLGVHAATIDPEGRIQLPVQLRDEVNLRSPEFRFMASLEADGSVCLRSREGFERWTERLRSADPRSQDARRTLLTVAAFSAPVKCDKQGRIRVPDPILRLAGIERSDAREVVLVGGFDEIRVWSPGGWNAFAARAREGLSAGLDELLLGASSEGLSATEA